MINEELENNKHFLFKALIYLAKIDGIISEKESDKLKRRLLYTGLFSIDEIESAINSNIDNIDDLMQGIKVIDNDLFIRFTELCIEMILSDNVVNDKEISGLYLLLSQRLPQLNLTTLIDYLQVKKKVVNYEKTMFLQYV